MNEKLALDLLHNISVKGLSLVAVKQRHDTTVQYNKHYNGKYKMQNLSKLYCVK